MKKSFALLLAVVMVFALAACAKAPADGQKTEAPTGTQNDAPKTEETKTDAPKTDETKTNETKTEEVKVMSYAEFLAAEVDAPVVVETYVQAHQSWWDNKVTVYCQDPDGAYFLYEMACSEADAEKLDPGTKIRVTGFKGEWAGEVEIVDATFEFLDGDYYEATWEDITHLLGTDEMIDYQNKMVAFSDMIVVDYGDGNAFAYKNPEEKTDDLYFKVAKDGVTYEFCVEFYLCGKDTEVYKTVEGLKIGDKVDLAGFLYWYEGPNPHITSVTVTEPILSYEDFVAAQVDDPVAVVTCVQAHQSWWDNKVTVYTQNEEGAYFLYELACTQEEAESLVPGAVIRVSGYTGEWAGEVEIVDATFTFMGFGGYVAEPVDVTALLGTEQLKEHQNQLVAFTDMTVEDYGDGNAFAYKDPEGKTDDLYFKVSKDGVTYEFCVEFYLCGKDTDVYKAVEGLKIGDKVDLTGFLYWYEGPNPHITSVTVK